MTSSGSSSVSPIHDSRTGIFPEVRGFKISEELARTPRGIIYKARRLVENDVVALKMFRRTVCDSAFQKKLASESEKTFFLEHSGLVRSLGCVWDPQDPNIAGRLLLITEFVQGESVARSLKNGKAFTASRALLAALQCANALQYAASHKRFHGRLHPADIVLGGSNARVLSVGLGEKPEHPAWSMKDPYLFEPLAYTAPEAMPSQRPLDQSLQFAAADIYSLGAVLVHMLTGAAPFKGTDEAALVLERTELKRPVNWPAGKKLPDEAVSIAEKMMSPAAERPTYEKLIPLLTDALFAAEKIESAAPKPPESPQFAKPGAAPLKEAPIGHSGSRGGIRPVPEHSPAPSPKHESSRRGLTPKGAFPALQRSHKKANTANLALVGLTAVAFVVALCVVFFYNPQPAPVAPVAPVAPNAQATRPPVAPTPNTALPIQQAPVQPTQPIQPVAPQPAQPVVPVAPVISQTEQQKAIKQFELIEEMLKRGEIKHSAALHKRVKKIAETIGDENPTGIKAVLLAGEIEDSLVKNFGAQKDLVNNPGVAATSPKDPAPPVEPNKVDEAAAKAAEAKAARDAEEVARKKGVVTAALKSAQGKAAKYQYAEALAECEKVPNADDDNKLMATYAAVVKLEQEFFQRCRARLLKEIETSPKKESPLQVFPRKNDPIGDDIVDFDDKGLTINAKKGPKIGKRVQDWDKVPAAQALILLQLLSDKKDIEDLAAAVAFAYNHNLGDKTDAALDTLRAIPAKEGADGKKGPDGKERADALAENFKSLREFLGVEQK